MYSGGTGGAPSRPMAWTSGGSTKPPAVDNYLESHGLNSGLGNASYTKFPSVVESKPLQVKSFSLFEESKMYKIGVKNDPLGQLHNSDAFVLDCLI